MSLVKTKRPAEQDDFTPPKRQKGGYPPHAPASKNILVYQMSVKLPIYLIVYPDKLLETLRHDIRCTSSNIVSAANDGTMPKPSVQYSMIHRSYVSNDLDFESKNTTGFLMHVANLALLTTFFNTHKKLLEDKAVPFVQLETNGKISNPDFSRLHSVRHGEVGWGYDCEGGLSLYQTNIVDGKLCSESMFVQAETIKKEES